MKEVRKEEIKKVLKEGAIIYLKGSNMKDKRLYRLNGSILEYSDNNKDWSMSNMLLEELETREWVVLD